ncbi:hypothetical protein VQ042_11555 [Aurantimonas sp. A2-1-M11]|uniref:hypothetical protein n=1 Tax=Aurantimonas sp. A2-1-M11 TaxID=3113712 RepID=UPI002F94FCDE
MVLEGETKRMRRERENLAWQAWTTAALYRSKKMPKLRDIMPKEDSGPRRMSPEDIEAVTRSWLAGARRNR